MKRRNFFKLLSVSPIGLMLSKLPKEKIKTVEFSIPKDPKQFTKISDVIDPEVYYALVTAKFGSPPKIYRGIGAKWKI